MSEQAGLVRNDDCGPGWLAGSSALHGQRARDRKKRTEALASDPEAPMRPWPPVPDRRPGSASVFTHRQPSRRCPGVEPRWRAERNMQPSPGQRARSGACVTVGSSRHELLVLTCRRCSAASETPGFSARGELRLTARPGFRVTWHWRHAVVDPRSHVPYHEITANRHTC